MEAQVLTQEDLTRNLALERIGRPIHAYDMADSTMDIAHRLAAAGACEGTAVFAEQQRKGRGRQGRSWLSPKGQGIYMSLILRPILEVSSLSMITLMAAVVVARAIRQETGINAQIKWPNDLLIRGKKICGILTESKTKGHQMDYLVLGIGLNVNSSKEDLPAHATSLSLEAGEPIDRLSLARQLLRELDQGYQRFLAEGAEPVLNAWRGMAHFLGSRIRVAMEGRVIDGQAVDVDSTGALLVRTDSGLIESIIAGEVLIVRQS